jgi:cell division protein ZapE
VPTDTSDLLARYSARAERGELQRDPAQETVARALNDLRRRLIRNGAGRGGLFKSLFSKREVPRGLYIHGDVGRGKSMLMDLFFETAPLDAKVRVHFHEFMLEVHDEIHRWRKARKTGQPAGADAIGHVAETWRKRAALLCFDEFQVHQIADAMILGRLFSALFDRGVVMVSTSNTAPDDLYKDGLNRSRFVPFIELLKRHADVLQLDGDMDYRLDRMKGHDVYHTPLDAGTAGKMQAAWLALTDAPTGAPAALTLKGRVLQVPQAARGVARFQFEELCGKPLGAEDYLKLAQSFHTVMIDSIPVLTAERRDQAKRLVTLVDALYETRTKLIASAAAKPQKLHVSGKHAFEMKRTISRLIEMQSADYLSLGHCVARPGPEGS